MATKRGFSHCKAINILARKMQLWLELSLWEAIMLTATRERLGFTSTQFLVEPLPRGQLAFSSFSVKDL